MYVCINTYNISYYTYIQTNTEKCITSWWKSCLESSKMLKEIFFLSMNKNKKENKNTTTIEKQFIFFLFY